MLCIIIIIITYYYTALLTVYITFSIVSVTVRQHEMRTAHPVYHPQFVQPSVRHAICFRLTARFFIFFYFHFLFGGRISARVEILDAATLTELNYYLSCGHKLYNVQYISIYIYRYILLYIMCVCVCVIEKEFCLFMCVRVGVCLCACTNIVDSILSIYWMWQTEKQIVKPKCGSKSFKLPNRNGFVIQIREPENQRANQRTVETDQLAYARKQKWQQNSFLLTMDNAM